VSRANRVSLLLGLRNLLCARGVILLFCGASLCLFLRRLLVRGFRRFVTHEPKNRIHDKRSQYGQASFGRIPTAFATFSADRLGGKRGVGHPPTSRPQASRARTLLRGFRQNRGTAMADKQVNRGTQCRIRRYPGIAVRTPALETDDQVFRRHDLTPDLVRDRQHFPNPFDAAPYCTDRASRFPE
jgi:hypothetical protein